MRKLYLTLVLATTGWFTAKAQCVADFQEAFDPICVGQPEVFFNISNPPNNPSWTYSWNFGAGATPATFIGPNPPSVVYSTAGNKNITLTISNLGIGCSDVQTRQINVVAQSLSSFTSNAPQCVSAPVNFTYTGSASISHLWDFGIGAIPQISNVQNPQGIVYSSSGTKTITLKTNNGVCQQTTTQTITILSTPVAGIASTAPKCTGSNVDFINTGTSAGVSWLWNFGTGAAPATSSAQNPLGVVYSTPGSKVVTLSTTNLTTGCSNTATQTININQTPAPDFTNTSPQCVGATVNYNYIGNNAPGWTFLWDFGVGAMPATSTSSNPAGVLYSSSGSKAVQLTVTNGACSQSVVYTVTILATPVANFSSTAPKCTGLPVDFTNTGTSSGAVYSWALGSGAAPATSTLQNPSAVYSTAGTKLVSYTVTNSTTGCSSSITQAINVNLTPTVTFTSTAPKCAGAAVNFTNTGSTGGNWSYNWTFGASSVPALSNAQNPSGIAYSSGGTKKITLTISDGICTKTDTSSIFINSLPFAYAGKDTAICANAKVQIGSNAIAGNTYNWFPVNTVSNASASNPTVSPIAPTTQYIVTVTNTLTGCLNRDTALVTMLAPLIANAGVDGTICRNDSIQVGVGLIKGQVYSWAPAAGLNSTTSPNPVSSPSATTIYTLTVTGSGCPSVTDKVTITVHQLPIINAGKDATITVGSFTQLTVTGALQYSWTPPYALNNAGIYNPIASPDSSTNYIVKGTDIYGCINYDTIRVVVLKPTFWTPNTFTPDGNGFNDVFYVRGEGVKNFEFRVFNNWGEEIFFSNDIKIGWDGTRQLGGEKLPQGAYFYNVRGVLTDGTTVNAKDIVNLIR